MIDFAKYAFNKSHAAAYAVVSYQTAYLKYYFPVEFMAALMTSVMGNMTKLAGYIQECKEMKIEILPPDINEAGSGFTAHGRNIRYGLSAIKGVGKNVIDSIIDERNEGGPYHDLYDFCQRLATRDINKRAVENFIKAGAFDSFGLTRKQLIHIYIDVIDKVTNDKKSAISGQMSLFDLAGADQKTDFLIPIPDVGEFDQSVLLDFEKDVTGIYISGHPLDSYLDYLNRSVTARSSDFHIDEEGHVAIPDRSKAVIGGLISAVTKKSARNGQPMAFLTLEDLLGTVEVIVFPKDYAVFRPMIEEGRKVLISGRASVDSDADGKLILESMRDLDEARKEIWFQFRNKEEYLANERYISSLSSVDQLRGDTVIKIYLKEEKQLKIMDERYSIHLTDDFLGVLKQRFGEENVKVTVAKR